MMKTMTKIASKGVIGAAAGVALGAATLAILGVIGMATHADETQDGIIDGEAIEVEETEESDQ